MDSGDFRQEQALHLLLQVPVLRLRPDGLRQPGGDFTPQLRCRRLCVCNNEKIVQIRRAYRIVQIQKQSIHQHLGFAGTGSRRNQQPSAPVFHRLFLLRCQLLSHARPSPFRFPPRTAGQSWF